MKATATHSGHRPAYPEQRWLADLRFMARHYKDQPAVIGADLLNELRFGATWGGNDPTLDWHAAADAPPVAQDAGSG